MTDADGPEPACEYAHSQATYRYWDLSPVLLEQHPLCECCFPDGKASIPDTLEQVVRTGTRGSGKPCLHIGIDEVPAEHEIATGSKAEGPTGEQLATKLLKQPLEPGEVDNGEDG